MDGCMTTSSAERGGKKSRGGIFVDGMWLIGPSLIYRALAIVTASSTLLTVCDKTKSRLDVLSNANDQRVQRQLYYDIVHG